MAHEFFHRQASYARYDLRSHRNYNKVQFSRAVENRLSSPAEVVTLQLNDGTIKFHGGGNRADRGNRARTQFSRFRLANVEHPSARRTAILIRSHSAKNYASRGLPGKRDFRSDEQIVESGILTDSQEKGKSHCLVW